jgi:phage tail sheath protein FI
MPNYNAPGVYVEEVSGGARPIGAVGTSTAAFVGTAPQPPKDAQTEATPINNWTEFRARFAPDGIQTSSPLANAVFGFFANGGGRCYVVHVDEGDSLSGAGRGRAGLSLLEPIDEIAIVAAPGFQDTASYEAVLSHCESLQDRVAILDGPADVENKNTSLLTQVGLVAAPPRRRRSGRSDDADAPDDPASAPPADGQTSGLRPRDSQYGSFYFPHIEVVDPITGANVFVPPSGHMAGIWARTDMTRGVHKAPANESIRGALNLSYRVTAKEQEELNQHGVNCIRFFTSEGIKVWGARTLASDAEWRYLNVRRLFNMLKESIAEGTRWIVFEPNDFVLWRSITRDITAFLTRVWRDGALMGRTPQEAFFVKCDEETNPPDVRENGEVVTLIGVAPVKPAEFVVFKLSQSSGVTETQTVGG